MSRFLSVSSSTSKKCMCMESDCSAETAVSSEGNASISLFNFFANLLIFHAFCRLLIFFINIFVKKNFQEYHQSVKQFGSRSGPSSCRA